MDNQIQELDSTYLIQLLPTNSEDPLTKKLLGIINGRQKKTWNEIFGILNEASEGTLFSFELQSDYNIGLTWEDMLSDSINFLPCYSYVMERILVSKWIDYQTKEASEAGELLLLEEKTKKHRRRRGKKAVDVSTCLPKSDKSAGNMSKSEDDFSSQIVHEYQEYSDDVNATIDMKLEEDVISKVSEEESAGEMPKSDFSSQIEHEYQEHSDDTSETTYNLHSVSGPSRQDSPRILSCQQDRISLQDYVKVTKLTKVYTLKPRKFFRILKKAVKMIEKSRMGLSNVAARKALALVLSLNLMTCAGRFCSRGFMTYIVLTHTSNNKCWNGLWDLSDMELRNGKFIITKEATFDLTAERVLADFKRYFAILLLPYFYNNELKAYPLYFDEFRADMLKVPDPISNPGEFHKFEKYMAIHFVFVPPLSRSIFLVNLYKAFESVRFVADNDFHPLNEAMPGDWRQNVRSVPIVEDVYYHGVRVGHEPYTNSYFHLLRFARHFCNHDLDKAKVGSVVQPIMDLMVTDLILSQLVAPELTDLIFFIVKKTGMGGNLFRVFQALETSDGRAILFPEDDADELPDDSGLHPMTVKPHKKLLKAVLCPEDDADELPDDSGTSSEDSETLREIA